MKRFMLLSLLCLGILFTFPLLCIAQDSTPAGWGDIFATLFANYIAPIFGAILIILVTALVKRIFASFGVKLTAEQEKRIAAFAEQAVRAMEELAAKSINESGNKIASGEKLRNVVSVLIEKFPKLAEAEAEQYALAAVNMIPGIGLTGNNPIPVAPINGNISVNAIKQ